MAAGASLSAEERRLINERAAAAAKAAVIAVNAQRSAHVEHGGLRDVGGETGRHLASPHTSPRSRFGSQGMTTARARSASPAGRGSISGAASVHPCSSPQSSAGIAPSTSTCQQQAPSHAEVGAGQSPTPRSMAVWNLTDRGVGSSSSPLVTSPSPAAQDAPRVAVSLIDQGRSVQLPSTKLQTYVVFVPEVDPHPPYS